MVNDYYRIADLQYIAAGAAILAGGGGGSYLDAVNIIKELEATGWSGAIPVQEYDGATNCCVLAMMGSPDAAAKMTLSDVNHSIANTIRTFQQAAGFVLSCIIPVEIGANNAGTLTAIQSATLKAGSAAQHRICRRSPISSRARVWS